MKKNNYYINFKIKIYFYYCDLITLIIILIQNLYCKYRIKYSFNNVVS